MAYAFNRIYRLEVGAPVKYTADMETINLDAVRVGDPLIKTFVFYDNHVSFSIKKTDKKDKNEATITIFNSNREFSAFLEENQGLPITVALWAGYYPYGGQPDLKRLFSGTVTYFIDTYEEADHTVELTCAEGAVQSAECKSQRSYRAGTPVDLVVSDLVRDLKVTESRIERLGGGVVLEAPMSFNGQTTEALKTVTDKYRMNYTIEDGGSIAVITADKAFKTNHIPLISMDSGLIGDIENWDDDEGTKKQDKLKKQTGYSVRVLLNGEYRINTFVMVKSRTLNSGRETRLKVARIEHKGELMGDDWTTKLFLKKVDKEATDVEVKTTTTPVYTPSARSR